MRQKGPRNKKSGLKIDRENLSGQVETRKNDNQKIEIPIRIATKHIRTTVHINNSRVTRYIHTLRF